MVRIQPTKLRWFLGTLQLSLDRAVLRAVVSLQRKPAVGPQLALGAEAVGRLDQSNQECCADWTDRRNLAQ